MKGANAKLSLQEAQHVTTYFMFFYFRKQSSRGESTPTTAHANSVHPEILNTLGLSFKNVHRSDLASGPLWLVLMMKNSLLGSLLDRINLYLKII